MKETLKRSQAVIKECGDKQVIVTYDLIVARIERQIQIQNAPKLNGVFVEIAQFHTILSLLSSIGKLLEGNGAAYLSSEAKTTADGSIKKFLKPKQYNCCRRGNLLVAAWLTSRKIY